LLPDSHPTDVRPTTGLAQAFKEFLSMTQSFDTRSTQMNLMYEDLARAHMNARLKEAREMRRGNQLRRAQRLARRAERATQQARLLLARAL
jgi:hypothetical protein